MSMEIFIRVGVSEGKLSGATVCTALGGFGGGEAGAVGKTWIEKLQASSRSVITAQQTSSRNEWCCSKAFSLCAVVRWAMITGGYRHYKSSACLFAATLSPLFPPMYLKCDCPASSLKFHAIGCKIWIRHRDFI